MKSSKNLLLTLTAIAISFLSGCQTTKSNLVVPEVVNEQIKTQQDSVETIKDEAGKAVALAPVVKPHTDRIVEEATEIDAAATQIKANHALVTKEASNKLNQLADTNEKLAKENKRLTDEKNKLLDRWLSVTIFASGLSLAVAIALFFLGKIRDLTIVVVAGAILLGAITLQFLLQYVMWIAIGVTIIVVVPLVYRAFVAKRSLDEVIETTEETKKLAGDSNKEEFKRIANELQSNSTIKLVKEIRNKHGLDTPKE
jgi:uncharacterized membrane protein